MGSTDSGLMTPVGDAERPIYIPTRSIGTRKATSAVIGCTARRTDAQALNSREFSQAHMFEQGVKLLSRGPEEIVFIQQILRLLGYAVVGEKPYA